MISVRRAACAVAAVAVMSVAACTGPDSTPAPLPIPTPSPPPLAPRLTGRLLVQAEDYTVWSISESGAAFTARRFVPAAGVAALSPDRRTLAYVTGTDITFRSTATNASRRQPMTAGGTRVLVASTDFGNATNTDRSPFPACLSWAPDGRHLVFLDGDGDLYVATPDGHAILVDRPRTAEYQTSKFLPFGTTYRSYVGCGAWLDARRFAFDRLAHPMPQYIAANTDLVMADTTAIATITGTTVKVVNTAGQWRLDGTCGTRMLITVIGANSATATVVTDTATAALARTGGPTGTALPADLASGLARFVPGSCAVIVVNDGAIHRYDPATVASTAVTVATPLDGAFLHAPADLAWTPGGDPTVFAGSDLYRGGSALQLFDLATGGLVELLPSGTGGASLPGDQVPQELRAILGWLPS